MSEQAKVSIQNLLGCVLTLLFGIPAVAAFFPAGTLDKLQHDVPLVLGAISTLLMVGGSLVAILPKSKATKIALAGELPQVSRIVTTDAIASASKNSDTVVSYTQAKASAPPLPKVA